MIFFIVFFSLKLPVQLVFITTEVVSSNPGRGKEYWYNINYVITFVRYLRKVGCVLWILWFPQTNQTNRHDIAEILVSGVKHHNHRNKISEYFPWNIIIPSCHLFTCGNKISDNPAAAPLPPFTYMPLRWGVLGTTICDKVCGWLAADSWFFSGTPVSSSNNIPTGKVWPMVSIIVLWIWLLFIILNLLSLVLFSIDICYYMNC